MPGREHRGEFPRIKSVADDDQRILCFLTVPDLFAETLPFVFGPSGGDVLCRRTVDDHCFRRLQGVEDVGLVLLADLVAEALAAEKHAIGFGQMDIEVHHARQICCVFVTEEQIVGGFVPRLLDPSFAYSFDIVRLRAIPFLRLLVRREFDRFQKRSIVEKTLDRRHTAGRNPLSVIILFIADPIPCADKTPVRPVIVRVPADDIVELFLRRRKLLT